MSVISDAVRLLNDESAAFSLLPATNYFYAYLKNPDPGFISNAIILAAIFLSAVWFNILSAVRFGSYASTDIEGEDDESSESNDGELIDGVSLATILGAAAMWILLFAGSLISLWRLFGESSILPELLAGISILFICLVGSDLLLTGILPIYNEDN